MEVSGTNTGAAAYALKKALELQGSAIELLAPQQSSSNLRSVQTGSTHSAGEDTSEITGKGRIIDIIA